MPAAERSPKIVRGHKTICIPCSQEQEEQVVDDPEQVRRFLDQQIEATPELLVPGAAEPGRASQREAVSPRMAPEPAGLSVPRGVSQASPKSGISRKPEIPRALRLCWSVAPQWRPGVGTDQGTGDRSPLPATQIRLFFRPKQQGIMVL
jgi:hypothetical protein